MIEQVSSLQKLGFFQQLFLEKIVTVYIVIVLALFLEIDCF